jgi:hypothetical protein
MTRRTLLACALTCAPVLSAAAQAPGGVPVPPPPGDSAAWIAERFFARDSFPDRARYYTGEMREYGKRPTLGSDLAPDVAIGRPRLAARDSQRAVYTVTVGDSAWTTDWYLHFRRVDGVWKLAAVRALWLSGVYEEVLASLDDPAVPEEFLRDSAAMRLTAQPDSVLRAHFAAHAEGFAALARFAAEHPGLIISTTDEDEKGRPGGSRAEAIRLLRAVKAVGMGRDAGGCFMLGIGG